MDINRRIKERNKETKKKALLKLLQTRIDNYIPSISFLTNSQINKFMDKCYDNLKHKTYTITINYKKKNDPNYSPFIFLLTKEQNKNNQKALKNKSKYSITFSGDHFKNKCKQTLDLNVKFSLILNTKLLTAKEIKDLKEELTYLEENLLISNNNKEILKKTREKIFDIKKKTQI